jgi:mono/diheme cytochrome c family protein
MTRYPRIGLLATSVLAIALSARAESRGELLYSTHCIACHTSQAHWRDKRIATDRSSLEAEVRRWQATAMLRWSEDDIADVTRYLNDTFYRFPWATGRTATQLSHTT